MAELEWSSFKGNTRGESTNFLTLEPGENRVRIVSNPFQINIHWDKAIVDGKNKRVICPGPGCPICKVNKVPQQRFQVLAINRKTQKVEILEGGPSVFNQIRDLAMDSDYGDPKQYDLKIKKEGSGRDTRYTVMPSPRPTPLTAEELEMVEANRSLTDMNKAKSIEDILAMGLESLAGSLSDLNDDKDWGTPTDKTASADLDSDWNSL